MSPDGLGLLNPRLVIELRLTPRADRSRLPNCLNRTLAVSLDAESGRQQVSIEA